MQLQDASPALEQVFRKFYAVLVLFARKLVHDKPAAEDIVSDLFCKLWERQMHFASMQSAKAFLYISTRNACINHLQRTGGKSGACNISQEAGSEDFVLNQIVRTELAAQLLQTVGNLPPRCRQVMRLSFFHGYSNRQIAHKMQLSINTVRNQRARGIHLIRKRYHGFIADF